MPAVPRLARGAERARQVGRQAVALPVGVAAGQRDRPLVAELGERLGREGRPVAGRAVEDDGAGAVRRGLLDPRLEVPARNVDGAGDPALLPLVALAHVDEHGAVFQELLGPGSVGLLDLGLHSLQQLAVGRHRFRLYSGATASWRAAKVAV